MDERVDIWQKRIASRGVLEWYVIARGGNYWVVRMHK